MKNYPIKPGSKLDLSECDPGDTGDYKKNEQGKEKAKAVTEKLIGKLMNCRSVCSPTATARY